MRHRVFFALLSLAVVLSIDAQGAPPRPDDFSRGMTIEAEAMRPIVQLDIPDAVYRSVTTDTLSDVRVFDAQGMPVPHALCEPPAARAPTISQQALPVFRLQDLARPNTGTRVEVHTPSGAQISVDGDAQADDAQLRTAAHVIDARGVSDELRALQFDWRSPQGESEVRVRIQASSDLDRWHTLIAGSTLLETQAGEQRLRRHRVEIPQARYEYLRIERLGHGPPLQIESAIAERVSPGIPIEPVWFAAPAVRSSGQDDDVLLYESDRRAPIAYARVLPVRENTSWQVAIESRAASADHWTGHWTGEVYAIATEGEPRVSPPARFAPTHHRHWRVRLTRPGDAFLQAPRLELAYRPARLRFLAQGDGPFTLAFGSRRAAPAPLRGCESLLADLPPAELEANIAPGIVGAERVLGGQNALRPLPKKTPLRQVVLWSVLVAGVVVLVAMAVSLLQRVRSDH